QVLSIDDSVWSCLVEAPPELSQDVISRGIHLVGGGSLLRGMSERLSQSADVPVSLIDAPLEAVVVGAGRCLESFEDVQAMFME
ncbi:MAG: rod shape-determining protein, partial [bacterium]|nr:rod shape-determining protein [bacterium]